MNADDVKRLKELERENGTLKRIVADKELENVALREAAADLVVVVCVDDQQGAQASALGSGEWPGEEDEAFVGEGVHERGVIGHIRLRGDSALDPARARFADDGVVAHRARPIREWKLFWSR